MADNAVTSDRKIQFDTPQVPRISIARSQFSSRKLSLAASFNSNLLGLPSTFNGEHGKELTNAKRRFSNVGDAVSRKLSSTIGWRNVNVPIQDVVTQGRMLCGHYIKQRLKRSGIFSKKSHLSQLRSAIGISPLSNPTVTEVAPFLTAAGVELERMYPKLFTSISRQASMAPSGILVSDKAAPSLLAAISHELLKSDITWGKAVSVFAIAGGLAVDCVCQGHPEYIHTLMDGMTEVLEDDLADWVSMNGGWTALGALCKYPEKDPTITTYFITTFILVVLFIFIYVVMHFVN